MLTGRESHLGAVQGQCLFVVKPYFLGALTGMSGEARWGMFACRSMFTAQAVCGFPFESCTAQPGRVHTSTASHSVQDHLKPRYCCGLTRSRSLMHSNWDVQNPFYCFFPCGDAWQDDRQFAWAPWGAVFLLNSV